MTNKAVLGIIVAVFLLSLSALGYLFGLGLPLTGTRPDPSLLETLVRRPASNKPFHPRLRKRFAETSEVFLNR